MDDRRSRRHCLSPCPRDIGRRAKVSRRDGNFDMRCAGSSAKLFRTVNALEFVKISEIGVFDGQVCGNGG